MRKQFSKCNLWHFTGGQNNIEWGISQTGFLVDQHTQHTPSMSKSLKLHCNVVLLFSNRCRMLYVLTHQKTCFGSVFLNVAMSTSEMLCVWIHQKTCLAHGSLNVIPSTSQSGEVAYQKKQIVPRISFLTFGIKCLLLEYTSRENYNFFELCQLFNG